METVRTRRGSAAIWTVVGALWAVAILSVATIGWFLMPVALVATVVAGSRTGGRGVLALVAAAALLAGALLTIQAVTADPETGRVSIPPP